MKIVDGEDYKCFTINGSVSHTAKLYLYGPPTLRSGGDDNLIVTAGKSIKIQCQVIGYPINTIKWEHNGLLLANNHRQKIEKNNLFELGHVLVIDNVQKPQDEGKRLLKQLFSHCNCIFI